MTIDAAAFGIAGPVTNGVCLGENLPWKREVRDTSAGRGARRQTRLAPQRPRRHGERRALSEGRTALQVQKGQPVEHGNIAVIAAGTGLGEAALIWHGTDYEPLPLEGGHTDLAIRNEEEIELFKFLLTVERPVNQEAVLCGSGMYNVYRY